MSIDTLAEQLRTLPRLAAAASVPESGPGPGRPTETIVTTAH